MTFQFPSNHHAGGWAPDHGRINRAQAQSALDYLVAHDISHPRKADQIQPGLYLGDLAAARNLESLQDKRISHVLSVCHCPDLQYPSSIKHKRIDEEDAQEADLLQHFKDCWRYIRDVLDAGGRILVHCEQGISRSPTILAAYLMREERMHPGSALTYIKKFRPIVDPNAGFKEQLDVWGNCRGELAGQADYIEWKKKKEQRRLQNGH